MNVRSSVLYLIPHKLHLKNWFSALFYCLYVYPVLRFLGAKNCAIFNPITLKYSCAWLSVNFGHSQLLKVLQKSFKDDQFQLILKWEKSATFWYWNFNILAEIPHLWIKLRLNYSTILNENSSRLGNWEGQIKLKDWYLEYKLIKGCYIAHGCWLPWKHISMYLH